MSILRCGATLLLLLLVACSFDGSALGERPPCEDSRDCVAPNSVCIAGSCSPAAEADAGSDTPDADTDTPPACDPGARLCDGNDVLICGDEGEVTVESCDDPAFCDGESCLCANGQCMPTDGCEPGTRTCQGDTIVECEDGVLTVLEECEEPLVCDDGECAEEQCEEGTLSCQGEVLVRCAPNGAGITVADCANSEGYCTEEPEPHCEPRICAPNVARCTEDLLAVETCNERGSAWLDEEPCLTDELCNRGICIPRACDAGTQDCAGVRVFTTCNETGDDSVTDACDEGFYCLDAGDTISCEPQTCEPGDRRCRDDGETVEICDDLGSGFTEVIECDGTQFCSDGFCSAQVCIPDSEFCVGDFSIATCNDRGSAFETVPCGDSSYCEETEVTAECLEQICEPDEGRCVDGLYDVIELCDDRGAEFVRADCGAFTACEGGECLDVVCAGGDVTCPTDFSSSTCLESGTGFFVADCPDGTFCDAGAGCTDQVCVPDTHFCDGDERLLCNGIGSEASSVEVCEFGCTDGNCRPSICGDGILSVDDGEECDDGNENGCDACYECRVANAGTIGTATITTGMAPWTIGVSDVTVEAWVHASTDGALFGVGARTAPDHLWVGVSGGAIVAELGLGSADLVSLEGTATVRGAWHHVAVQRFGAWGLIIYVDGVVDALIHEFGSDPSLDGAGRFWIGSDGSTTPATATLDQVHFVGARTYLGNFAPPRIITPGEFTVGFYDFDGEAGGALTDESTAGNDLTISGVSYVAEGCYGDTSAAQSCGDGGGAFWEECDDGNTLGGDGCGASCAFEVCGGGELRGPSDQCFWLTDSRHWSSARGVCGVSGGDLAIVDTELENDWVTFFLGLPTSHWIGLSAISEWSDPDWAWVDGVGLAGGESHPLWAPGEPSDSGCSGWTVDEDCAAIWGFDNPANVGLWNDFCCDTSRPGVCER